MGDKTAIEWTRSPDGTPGATWNPIRARHRVTGKVGWACVRVSPGCEHCYAERLNRVRGTGQVYTVSALVRYIDPFLDERTLTQPLRWTRPRRIFVASMTDLFWDKVPGKWIGRVFGHMAATPQHTFLVLTKRAERLHDLLADGVIGSVKGEAEQTCWELTKPTKWANDWKGLAWPLPNVWLGVSAEDQRRADERIPWLLKTPAAVRWVSAEPLLGPLQIQDWLEGFKPLAPDLAKTPAISWLVVGGESGGPPERALVLRCNSAEPHSCRDALGGSGRTHYHLKADALSWLRSIRDQCQAAGVAFFHKQNGGPTPKAGGRLLDGREWDEYPA